MAIYDLAEPLNGTPYLISQNQRDEARGLMHSRSVHDMPNSRDFHHSQTTVVTFRTLRLAFPGASPD